jgi:hypothetical protein
MRSDTLWGVGLKPDILFDGKRLGSLKAGSYLYVDARPGRHELLTSSEADGKLVVNLATGETKFVSTAVSAGVFSGRLVPTVITREEAEKSLPELSRANETAK